MWIKYLPVFLPLLSWRKIWNLFAIELSLVLSNLLRKSFVWGMPTQIMVEPTNICNLQCPLCANGAGVLGRRPDYLDLEVFKSTINELHPWLTQILFWNQGEPFLSKTFLEMIRYTVDRKIFTLASTNGHFLNNAQEICDSGLHALTISLDGATEDTYLKYRIGGDFQKVLKGIRGIVQFKRKNHKKTPVLILQLVITRLNEHEVPKIRKLARELEVNYLLLKTAEIPNKEDLEVYSPQTPRYRRYFSGNDITFRKNCPKLWTQPVLNSNGEWSVCCFDKTVTFPLGSSKQNGGNFREIWTSRQFNTFRKLVYKDRNNFPMCIDCSAHLKLFFDFEKTG